MNDPRPTMTVKDAARVLDVHPNTVRNWIKADIIEAYELQGGFKRPYADSVLTLTREFDPAGLRQMLSSKADRMEQQVKTIRQMVIELDTLLVTLETGTETEEDGDGAVRHE